jgi:hypothetical protein
MSNTGTFPAWMTWVQYLSPIRFTFELLIRNEFESRHVVLDPIKLLGFELGMYKCVIILISFSFTFRVISLICLKLMVSKF